MIFPIIVWVVLSTLSVTAKFNVRCMILPLTSIFCSDLDAFVSSLNLWQLKILHENLMRLIWVLMLQEIPKLHEKSFCTSWHECFLRLRCQILPTIDVVRDLSIVIDFWFRWSWRYYTAGENSSKIANFILRTLQHRCIGHYRSASIAYCRHILEYCAALRSFNMNSDIKLPETNQLFAKFTMLLIS